MSIIRYIRTAFLNKYLNVFILNFFPQIFSLLSIPLLLKNLGEERYGFMTLLFTMLPQIAVFDLGIARVLTRITSRVRDINSQYNILLNSLLIVSSVGLIITVFFLFFQSDLLQFFNISYDSVNDSKFALSIFSVVIFFTLLNNIVKAFLEGQGKIVQVNAIRNFFSAFLLFCMALLTYYYKSLEYLLYLWLSFVIVETIFLIKIIRVVNYREFFMSFRFKKRTIKILFTSGAFILISNLIGPFLVTMERYILAHEDSLKSVANYSVAFTLTSRLFLLSSAFQPFFYRKYAYYSANKKSIANNIPTIEVMEAFAMLIFLCTSLFLLISDSFLNLWLGQESKEIYRFTLILSLGIYINAVARMPYDYLQAFGKNHITAIIHIIELPFTYFLLLYAHNLFGVYAMVMAVSIRYFLEFIVLYIFFFRVLKSPLLIFRNSFTSKIISTVLYLLLFIIALYVNMPYIKIFIVCVLFLFVFNNYKPIKRILNEF